MSATWNCHKYSLNIRYYWFLSKIKDYYRVELYTSLFLHIIWSWIILAGLYWSQLKNSGASMFLSARAGDHGRGQSESISLGRMSCSLKSNSYHQSLPWTYTFFSCARNPVQTIHSGTVTLDITVTHGAKTRLLKGLPEVINIIIHPASGKDESSRHPRGSRSITVIQGYW